MVTEQYYLLTIKTAFGTFKNRFKDQNDAIEYAERMRAYLSTYGACAWVLELVTTKQTCIQKGGAN